MHCFPFVLLRVILLFKAPLTIYLPELTEIISYIHLKNNSSLKALFSVFCVNIWDVYSNLRISLRYVSGESWFLSAHFCVQMEGLLHPVQRSRLACSLIVHSKTNNPNTGCFKFQCLQTIHLPWSSIIGSQLSKVFSKELTLTCWRCRHFQCQVKVCSGGKWRQLTYPCIHSLSHVFVS